MTHMLCCRITEILKLRRADIDFKKGAVFVASLKKGPAIIKHIMKPAMKKLRDLRAKGVGRTRTRNMGMWGRQRFQDTWSFPEEGGSYLLPSLRADAHKRHINKDTVCKAVSRLRDSFQVPKSYHIQTTSIRSHSGRHRMVNDMRCCGVPDATATHYARIKDQRTGSG